MSAEGRLLVRQERGVAGRPWTQRLVLKGLGLRGPGSQVVVANERAIRGMIRKVLHLVAVEEVSADEKAVAKPSAKAASKVKPAGAAAKPAGAAAKSAAAAKPASSAKPAAAAKPASPATKKVKS